MADAHKNFATSLVATAPSPATSGTSLTVTAGQGTRFPAAPFNAVVCPVDALATPDNAEVVRVTDVTTDTLTVTRAQESSTARAVMVGDRIYAGPTAKSLTDIEGNVAVPQAMALSSGVVAEGVSIAFARADHDHGLPWGTNALITAVPGVQYAEAPVSTATGTANTYYSLPVITFAPITVTGVEYRNGATVNGTVRSALYDYLGTRVADRTSGVTQANTNSRQRIAFDSTYAAAPGIFYMLLWFSSATATCFQANVLGTRAATGTNASTTPTSPGTLVANIAAPVMSLY